MSTDLKSVFTGIQAETYYIAKTCPLCDESYSFRIFAGDLWECVACGKSGDLDDLKREMGDDLFVRLEQIKKPKPPEGLILLGDYEAPEGEQPYSTGFNPLDRAIGGLEKGNLTVLTGQTGHGKSTFMGQMALGLIEDGATVCFYSGELKAKDFQSWMLNQAAGPSFLDSYIDRFGETRYKTDDWIKQRIKAWLKEKKFVLYDNSIVKSDERNSIIERFTIARQYYGCDFFFVDNLMSARIPLDQERDFYRAQSNFVHSLKTFALTQDAHVILAAHPRKNKTSDWTESVSGSGDITYQADCLLAVQKLEGEDHDADIDVAKGRMWGDTGAIAFNFDKNSRRFVLTSGSQVEKYGWEDAI